MLGSAELNVAETPRNGGAARPPHCAAISFAAVCRVLLAWIPSLVSRLDPLTGDEPFHVMTSLSLMQDGDLDELNNCLERDFDSFSPEFGPTRRGWPEHLGRPRPDRTHPVVRLLQPLPGYGPDDVRCPGRHNLGGTIAFAEGRFLAHGARERLLSEGANGR